LPGRIYFDAAKNRYVGAISVGFGPGGKRIRCKVTGKTKAEVRDKLKAAHAELDRGLPASPATTEPPPQNSSTATSCPVITTGAEVMDRILNLRG
jgi:hypothetical protein